MLCNPETLLTAKKKAGALISNHLLTVVRLFAALLATRTRPEAIHQAFIMCGPTSSRDSRSLMQPKQTLASLDTLEGTL